MELGGLKAYQNSDSCSRMQGACCGAQVPERSPRKQEGSHEGHAGQRTKALHRKIRIQPPLACICGEQVMHGMLTEFV